jgi:hypothetical protein
VHVSARRYTGGRGGAFQLALRVVKAGRRRGERFHVAALGCGDLPPVEIAVRATAAIVLLQAWRPRLG